MSDSNYYIVRTDRAGVFFCKVKENKGSSIVITDARKIHYWEKAAAVEEISQNGIGGDSRLTLTVPEMEVADPIQIIPCTEKAAKVMREWREWKFQ